MIDMRAPFSFTRTLVLLIGITLTAAACSNKNKDADGTVFIEGTVEDLYNRGTDLMLAGKYTDAAKFFSEVERQHPYSSWARRAQLMSAYANYRGRNYNIAITQLNRFIRLYPSYRDISYAYYLRGLSYYDQIRDVKRDQTPAVQALSSFEELTKRFPQSRYTRDAQYKVNLIRDHLAGHEMEVGRFYLVRKQYLAAIGRFTTVVKDYQTTSQVPEALLRLTESYTALGLQNEARRVAAVLGYNYPSSEWYVDSYELVTNKPFDRSGRPKLRKRSFWRRTVDWIF